MNQLILYEEKEFNRDFVVIDVIMEPPVPVCIKNTIEYIKDHNPYVKQKTICGKNVKVEYFKHSVLDNDNGPALIDFDGNRKFFSKGKEIFNSELLINKDRNNKLKEILKSGDIDID